MKQKDMLLIVTVVIVSAIFAFIFTRLIISPPKNRQQKVEVVEPISTEFPSPDQRYFNNQSIDPTERIRIGENSNPQPFNSGN